MPTKKSTTTRRTTNATAPANGDAASLPAEPEVTRRSAAATSNPGREPAHLAAARARRQQ